MTNTNKELKLFISYCHKDEDYINDFIKHLSSLKNKGLINEWYDRKINGGDTFQSEIDSNLQDADIICLFISPDFLNSNACMKEKEEALVLRKNKHTVVIPIIIRKCPWLDYEELSELMAFPNDAKSVSEYSDKDAYYLDVVTELKKVIEKRKLIKEIEIEESFKLFLQDTDLLKNAHPNKTNIYLDDIFVEPKFKKYNSTLEYDKAVNLQTIKNELLESSKIVIAGEGQSGKTSICKQLYQSLLELGLFPVYVEDKQYRYSGRMDLKIEKEFNNQYNSKANFKDISSSKIIPIIDNFHYAKNKEKHIELLKLYDKQILIVDDIFSIDFSQGKSLYNYIHYTISEFSPSKRFELIEKWINISPNNWSTQNELYQDLDSKSELVDSSLGKIIGSGVMPSYPFFILSVLSTYESFNKPLNQEISSQGYCYQALIYMYLKKQGVKNEDFDTYLNFLTEFSFYLYNNEQIEVSNVEFINFLDEYNSNYNLPIDQDKLLINLRETNIISLDNFGNYSFSHSYLYYFFIAKYLAENVETNKKDIDKIFDNLHIDDNAYITIFISHHIKDDSILEEIITNSMCLFEDFKPSTLCEKELGFFDIKVEMIQKAVLPNGSNNPTEERKKRLEFQEIIENDKVSKGESANLKVVQEEFGIEEDIENNDFSIDLRKSFKTVEVMGRIIKNRAGSLKRDKLEEVYQEAMNVHLRLLSFFISRIKDEDSQSFVEEFIITKIKKQESKNEKELNNAQLKKLSQQIFWNINFALIYGILNKIIHSLGSDKLTNIIESVSQKQESPSTFIIKHGILMWYNKNLQSTKIADKIDSDGFSKTAKEIMNHMIVSHCKTHKMGHKEIQKIESRFNISAKNLKQLR